MFSFFVFSHLFWKCVCCGIRGCMCSVRSMIGARAEGGGSGAVVWCLPR